ncbi:restriction endonuclease [Micromonospora sp. WMMD729]|uniref:restriction endonuclease n=1 Tax=Micromonospora sp. WMMD729 TaxID=3404127 RepID=UPI003BF55335
MARIGAGQLAGYVLEEIIAWMLLSSGYKLLTRASDDPDELVAGPNGLRVRGRGAEHQADVLGELIYVPPFSLPLRMFVEAKCHKSGAIGLGEVRNAHGVIHDVNQNWASQARPSLPQQRYHYLYSMFSTSGFTRDAQEYAQAHQIVLVDLSTSTFKDLSKAVRDLARRLVEAWGSDGFPTGWVRNELRRLLGTDGHATGELASGGLTGEILGGIVDEFAAYIVDDWKARMLLGFPAAPLILPLLVTDMAATLDALAQRPVMRVRLRHVGETDTAGSWLIESVDPRVQFRFSLPDSIERWMADDPEKYRARRATYKQLLSDITIVYAARQDVQVYRLVYDAADWRRG